MTSTPIVAVEPFGSIWPECLSLAEAHWHEVEVGMDPRRKLDLDYELMSQLSLAGALLVVSARCAGALVGYFTWTVSRDPESRGLVIAQQGAWYVSPGHWGLARRMLDRSIAELQFAGVQCIYPHHRLVGRGQALSREFLRRGAQAEKQVYSLWIGTAHG